MGQEKPRSTGLGSLAVAAAVLLIVWLLTRLPVTA